MEEITPEPALAELLEYAEQAGVVINYVLLALESPRQYADLPDEDLHLNAALAGMWAVDDRLRRYAEAVSAVSQYPVSSFFRLTIAPEAATGRVETPEKFLYDYWKAFSDPPYRLAMPRDDARAVFDLLNETLFPDLPTWSLYRWSDDWSNYFDAGREWWGAYLWTLIAPDRQRAVWIGASTTD
jgi:hypothetical protein